MQVIKRFSTSKVPDCGVIVFTGNTGSGKTVGMTHLLYRKRNVYDKVVLFSGSAETCEDFARHIPAIMIHDKYDEQRISSIYESQELARAEKRMKPVLIILDDLMYLHNILKKSEVLNRIFFNGRHAGIGLWISMQYCKSLGPDFRSQVKVVFLGLEKNPERRKRIFEAFNNVFRNFNDFDECMRTFTQNYSMLVLPCTNNRSDSVSDNVFWWKARTHSKFRVNPASAMWSVHKHMFDEEYIKRKRLRGIARQIGAGGRSGKSTALSFSKTH